MILPHKVLRESVLQVIMSSEIFKLSSPNDMKTLQVGQTARDPITLMKASQTIHRSMH